MPYTKDVSASAMERVLNRPTAIPSGMSKLDARIEGLELGEVTYICGKPGHGKSTLAIQIGQSVADYGVPVLVSSLEMSSNLLVGRMVHAISGVEKRMNRKYTVAEIAELQHARGKVDDMPIWIEEGLRDVADFERRAGKLIEREGIGLAIVDYIQLMRAGELDGESRFAQISVRLKGFAVDHNIPVIAVSQLSRAHMQRGDEVPQPQDLRGSGQLEQDAFNIIACVDHQQFPRSKFPYDTALHVIKAREGIIGPVPVNYRKAAMRFEELSDSEVREITGHFDDDDDRDGFH